VLIKLNDISIRNKLILMQVFTSVFVLSIVFAFFEITDIRFYKNRKADSMVSLAQVIGTNSVSTLEFQDQDAAKQILSELHTVDPVIVSAIILDKDGKLFASYAKHGVTSFPIPAELNKQPFVYTDNNLFVSNPIVNSKKEVIGKVMLGIELTELEQIKKSRYGIAFVLLIIALGLSFVIALLVQTYISRRLLKLVSSMKDVSKSGNYNKVIADDGKDEISILTKVYNNLMLHVQESQRRKDEFIGIASHELKTPLTSIKGYIDLLNVMEDTEPNKQFILKALENINKLERLIKDLLDVSKIQSGQLELSVTDFNLDTLIDDTIAAFQMVSVTHEISRDGKFGNEIISADRQRIEQILINLLSNAIKYSPGEKQVIVYSKKTDKELLIKVRDFGIGIPKDEEENIFERFYRTKDTSIHISGFGLGLYICRDIITRHNGKIWVEAEKKGTSFYFSLPLKIIPAYNKQQNSVNV
jgi:signal transduction histidine kinase